METSLKIKLAIDHEAYTNFYGKGAFSVCFVRPSVIPSFRPSVPSKFVFSTPPTSLRGFE